ncbi:hypothetical protein M1186_25585, partial [Salmonella enterica subsp. enterica serovar Minnesota]|nr:hypothetical protein [Salmonella enterica subsp. enterica serovar Minnesota]
MISPGAVVGDVVGVGVLDAVGEGEALGESVGFGVLPEPEFWGVTVVVTVKSVELSSVSTKPVRVKALGVVLP